MLKTNKYSIMMKKIAGITTGKADCWVQAS